MARRTIDFMDEGDFATQAPVGPPMRHINPFAAIGSSITPILRSSQSAFRLGTNALRSGISRAKAQTQFTNKRGGVVGTGRSARALAADSTNPFGVFAVGTDSAGNVLSRRGAVTDTLEGRQAAQRAGIQTLSPEQAGIRDVSTLPVAPRSTLQRLGQRLAGPSPQPRQRTFPIGGEDVPITFQQQAQLSTGPIATRKRVRAELAQVAQRMRQEKQRVLGVQREKDERKEAREAQERGIAGDIAVAKAKGQGQLDVAKERTLRKTLELASDEIIKSAEFATDLEKQRMIDETKRFVEMSQAERDDAKNAADIAMQRIESGTDTPADRADAVVGLTLQQVQFILSKQKLDEDDPTRGLIDERIGVLQEEITNLQTPQQEATAQPAAQPAAQPSATAIERQFGSQEAQQAAAQAFNAGGPEAAQAAWEQAGGTGTWPGLLPSAQELSDQFTLTQLQQMQTGAEKDGNQSVAKRAEAAIILEKNAQKKLVTG